MVTENETGLFQCDQETKQQSMQWKTPASLRPRNTRVSKNSKYDSGCLWCWSNHCGCVSSNWMLNQQFHI